jgi:phosphoenolpyruvate carboxylase
MADYSIGIPENVINTQENQVKRELCAQKVKETYDSCSNENIVKNLKEIYLKLKGDKWGLSMTEMEVVDEMNNKLDNDSWVKNSLSEEVVNEWLEDMN